MLEPTNKSRATLARDSVVHMAYRTGSSGEPLSTQISDLLANLRHLCEAEILSFRQLDAQARDHWLAERDETTATQEQEA